MLADEKPLNPIAKADPAAAVGLARLILLGREPEMGAGLLGRFEPRDRRWYSHKSATRSAPGVDINSLAFGFDRAMLRAWFSKAFNSRSSAACTDSSASIVFRTGWPFASSRIRAAKLRSVVAPTLRLKPRKKSRADCSRCP